MKDHKENIIFLFFTVFIMQLTTQRHVFLVTGWMRSRRYQVVSQEFSKNFPERNVPNRTTAWKNVKKYREEGTSLNLNRGCSGRRRTAKSEEHIANVRQLLNEDAHATGRRNPLQIYIYPEDLKSGFVNWTSNGITTRYSGYIN